MNDDLKRTLESSALFAEMPAGLRARLLPYFEILEGDTEDGLFAKGDPSDGLFVVLSGSCDVRLQEADGSERTVSRLHAGDTFGEISLIVTTQRKVAVVAREPTNLATMSRESFKQLKREAPDAGLQLVLAITRRLARVLEGSTSAFERLLKRSAWPESP